METKGFIGQRYDADAGLQYLNARDYDPKLAMFIQSDWWKVMEAGSNRYGYCVRDPVNCTEASGHVPDNWATKSKPVAYDSNGFNSTYQGKGKLDKVTYASWNDKNSKDSKKYPDNPRTYDKRQRTVGVLGSKNVIEAVGRGTKRHEVYGSVKIFRV